MDGTLKKRKSDPSYRLFLHWIAAQTRGYHSECSPRAVLLRRNILMAAFNQPQLFQATHDAVDGALHRRRHRLGLMAAPIQRRELFVLLGIPRKPLMRVPRLRIKTSAKNRAVGQLQINQTIPNARRASPPAPGRFRRAEFPAGRRCADRRPPPAPTPFCCSHDFAWPSLPVPPRPADCSAPRWPCAAHAEPALHCRHDPRRKAPLFRDERPQTAFPE